jgi:hypothetical protein
VRNQNIVAKVGKHVVTFAGEPLLTSRDVATALNVSKSSVDKWRGEGRGPKYVEVEGTIRYTPQALADDIATNTRTSTSQEINTDAA